MCFSCQFWCPAPSLSLYLPEYIYISVNPACSFAIIVISVSSSVLFCAAVRRVPPRFTILPSSHEIMPGGSVNITCVAVGSPMPYVKWMLNSEDLTPEDEMPVGRNVLELNGVRESANYTCVAMSSLGIIDAVAQVIVKCKRDWYIHRLLSVFIRQFWQVITPIYILMEGWKSGTFLLISPTERYHLLFAIWMVVVDVYSRVCFPRSGAFYSACLHAFTSLFITSFPICIFFSVS